MLKPEFGSEIEAEDEAETATLKPTLGDRAETGIYQCCGSHCSCGVQVKPS